MPEYDPNNYTATQIGEDYYDWVQEYLSSPYGSLADLQQPILPSEEGAQEEDYLVESFPGYTFYQNLVSPWIDNDDEFQDFFFEYGNLFSQDYELGPASLQREQRLGEIQINQLTDQFNVNRNTASSNLGRSGFSGSGLNSNMLNDLWSEYVTQSNAINLQTEQATSDIYTAQGESIMDTLEEIAEIGGFNEYGTGG